MHTTKTVRPVCRKFDWQANKNIDRRTGVNFIGDQALIEKASNTTEEAAITPPNIHSLAAGTVSGMVYAILLA